MTITRRSLLRAAAVAGAATALPRPAAARPTVLPGSGAVGMLYDATRCVGCQGCVAACKEANGLPMREADLPDGPTHLDDQTKSIVRKLPTARGPAFIKRQCMHCVDPSCVSVCMLGALHKEGEGKRVMAGERKGTGVVVYDKEICVGCRYCQIACAFAVPKFEWDRPFPAIVKCELCHHRADPAKGGLLALANPACAETCPAEAVVYGLRADLLAEARRRIAAEPARYGPKIYGETDGGGTQVLYLAPAGVAFSELGLPELPAESSAHFSETVSHAPFLHGATPIALYAAAAFVVRRNRRKQEQAEIEPTRGGESR